VNKQTILNRIKKHFPAVKDVVDAKAPVFVEVLPEDGRIGRKKDPEGCAFARACLRKHLADGCIIGIAYSYLIKGSVATRYMTPGTVGREITSFDRHQDFAEGQNYPVERRHPLTAPGGKAQAQEGRQERQSGRRGQSASPSHHPDSGEWSLNQSTAYIYDYKSTIVRRMEAVYSRV
jgi:hypothetical protein